jgi:uncharacterized BrkB/YihY/UPF0761 family membrane protein
MKIKTKNLRTIYILLAIVLGIILGVMIYAVIEKARVNSFLAAGLTHHDLPASTRWIIIFAGAIMGYVLGVRWWQLVYVKKQHWRKRLRGRFGKKS